MRIAAVWLSSAGQLPVPAALEYRISGIANTPLLFSDNVGIILTPHFYYTPIIMNCQYGVLVNLFACYVLILCDLNYKIKNNAVYRK